MNQLTQLQRATLFSHIKGAASECGEPAEDYRKRIMREELGVDHLSEVSRTDGFDILMCRIFKDLGQYDRAIDFVGGDVKRLGYLAMEEARAIVRRSGGPWTAGEELSAYRYVAGVMVQMRFSRQTVDSLAIHLRVADGWSDFTPIQLKKVVAALNIHRRGRA